jgi:hypothetical protein
MRVPTSLPLFGRTRNPLTFVNTTAIAYKQKVGRSLKNLVYAIAVVFTNVRGLRVPVCKAQQEGAHILN